jgi:hypothetical protein
MRCPGVHCPGCGDGGGAIAGIIAVVVICLILARPVEHAADELLHVVLVALEIVAVSVAGIAVLGGIGAIAYRRYQRRSAIAAGSQRAAVADRTRSDLHVTATVLHAVPDAQDPPAAIDAPPRHAPRQWPHIAPDEVRR